MVIMIVLVKLPAKNPQMGGTWRRGWLKFEVSFKIWSRFLEKISTLASYSIHKSDVSDALSIWVMKREKTSVKYTFYGGSTWFTVSKQCVERYFNFIKNNQEYDELFHKALMGDEIYFFCLYLK